MLVIETSTIGAAGTETIRLRPPLREKALARARKAQVVETNITHARSLSGERRACVLGRCDATRPEFVTISLRES